MLTSLPPCVGGIARRVEAERVQARFRPDQLSAGDLPSGWLEVSHDKQEKVIQWIKSALVSAKGYFIWTSYGLKHHCSGYLRRTFGNNYDHYLSNGQFKGAMLAAGFYPRDPNELNWEYKQPE